MVSLPSPLSEPVAVEATPVAGELPTLLAGSSPQTQRPKKAYWIAGVWTWMGVDRAGRLGLLDLVQRHYHVLCPNDA
jgi:hypothetical protein